MTDTTPERDLCQVCGVYVGASQRVHDALVHFMPTVIEPKIKAKTKTKRRKR